MVQCVAVVGGLDWYAVAYAASQASSTWLNDCTEPRSTCSQAVSTHSLAHRVP